MKKLLYTLATIALAGGMLVSCEKSAIDPLSGAYPAAEQLKGVAFTDGGRTTEDGFMYFLSRGRTWTCISPTVTGISVTELIISQKLQAVMPSLPVPR